MRSSISGITSISRSFVFAASGAVVLAGTDNSVAPDELQTYRIVTSRDTIVVGEQLELVASPVGNNSGHSCSNIISKKLTFSVSEPSIIAISPVGFAIGLSPGTAAVSLMAPCNSMTEPKTLTVITR